MERTDWDELAEPVRAAIEARTGPVHSACTALAGRNSALALLLDTDAGAVFVKGLRSDHPGVVTQRREAAINPHVRTVGPQLLWRVEVAGWDLLGFAHMPGRHADYRPGSPDVPAVVEAMRRLAALPCPRLPELKRAEQRWAAFVDHPEDAAVLCGQTLLHTDYNPDNVLIHGSVARLIDWAWPTAGAAFIDPACLVVRLVAAGHSPVDAEAAVDALPAWQYAPRRSVHVAAEALTRMWAQIADVDPVDWKRTAAWAAAAWREHRQTIL